MRKKILVWCSQLVENTDLMSSSASVRQHLEDEQRGIHCGGFWV